MAPRKNTKKANGVDTENEPTTTESVPSKRSTRTKNVVNYIEEKISNSSNNTDSNVGKKTKGEKLKGIDAPKTKAKSKGTKDKGGTSSEPIKESATKTKAKSKSTKEKDDEPSSERIKESAAKTKGKPKGEPTKKSNAKSTEKDSKTKSTKDKEPIDDASTKKTTKRKEKVTEDTSSKKAKRDASPISVSSKSEESETQQVGKKTSRRKRSVSPKQVKNPKAKSSKESQRDASPISISSDSEETVTVKKPSTTKRSVSPERAPKSSKTDAKKLKNKTENDWKSIDYSCSRLSASDKDANFKIVSWNVDGIRAWHNKGCFEYIEHEKPDIFCIQETKSTYDKLPDDIKSFKGYHQYWCSASKEGYSGVGLFTKKMPLNVINGINDDEHDAEGRVITAEFEYFFIISVYVPNSGRGLVTLPKRLDWNKKFLNFCNDLNKTKPIIICGDMNVAHQEIDLKNPKSNKKNAGFTQEERDDMSAFLANGYLDTFRKLYPKKTDAYTFWSYMSNSRAKNTGWRLDYFLISEKLENKLCDSVIRSSIFGSDHCPIVLYMSF